ncbi:MULTISPECIES: 2-oxoglutarate dehydrogenase E1 component [Petrimonas]|uniref:2-oxoglutarate dehydrogenase E1 component n=1 Tax=Petrimonas TaxID=307628 RepID=UPI0008E6E085|nr:MULTISPECIES: 2-oxoglutarate dehydrogenase E1 component [Petrimonas]MDD3560281.1 2-oxoglutarate dehydrogenase E1 component [Petrimonas mucosa]SFU38150.1 2-oxoglutarate dehydrogenase E1 component [Porphyromonadaceae bacterium KHP3R9]
MDIGAIEALYKQYKENPENVDESFRFFFQGFDLAIKHFPTKPRKTEGGAGVPAKEIAVMNLITAYRRRGHLFTKTNPVRTRRSYTPTLDLQNFNLSEEDLDTEFEAGKEIGIGRATLREIVEHLNETYCKSIGVEYRYMTKPEIVQWLQQKMEGCRNQESLSGEQKLHILDRLVEASGFEDYMHRKYVGQKRFSLEGSEAIIPALDAILTLGGDYDVNEIVIGMAHRGRLNVLTNIMKKPYYQVFREFTAENYEEENLYGDVKYHLGYNNTIDHEGRKISVNLSPNPSHLEAVGPVVEGIAKARLELAHDYQYNQVLPILIHGDAAIAGQGVVYETIQFSKLDGYKTGGTIHIVINNQVGFTTNYLQARSSTYCTDIAKVTQSPVFHVNGDDVEAMVFVAKLALEFRQKFNIDVFIDLLSYRKYGHNEGDEPRFTQPKLYEIIAKHKNPRDIYAERLIDEGVLTRQEYETRLKGFQDVLDQAYAKANQSRKLNIHSFLKEQYREIRSPLPEDFETVCNTAISKEMFLDLARRITTLPEGKRFYNKTIKLFSQRADMIKTDAYDWAMGELMAYASLAKENYPVRLSGQDSERGTFSHRHAEIITEDGEEKYFPLKNLGGEHATVRVYNSPLNEYGVLGFEYGYSLANPFGLTIWEAQFGDFFNVGQVIVDQYISAAHEKWGVKSGLVMFLPHGYEGQGAEHSSGRMERFLTQCANLNLQVVNPTTPANHFHVIRRQLHRDIRVPLILFTPKSLLRHPECTSTLADFTEGHFREVIGDDKADPSKVSKVLLCTGKIYYELEAARRKAGAGHIAVIRIEQLYPFPEKQLKKILKGYRKDAKLVWVQEEPLNMGAALFVKQWMGDCKLEIISRPPSGVTAEGLTALHKIHQAEIITEAMK